MPSPNARRSTAIAIAACTFAVPAAGLAAGQDQGASGLLRRVQFLPAGTFRSGDTRPEEVPAWRIDAASAATVIRRFGDRKKPLVIDYEHQTLHKEKNGQPAPAAGWTKSLEWVEGEGLFAQVEMTARAAAAIDGKEYRFFSPVFTYSPIDGTVLEVQMGALTNDPGLQGMQPVSLVAAATAAFLFDPEPTERPVNPLLKALLTTLGLPETTTEDGAIAALTALGPLQAAAARATAACTALGLSADATPDAVTAACSALRAETPPDPGQYVPIAAVKELQASVAALTAAQVDGQVDALVKPALADSRLLPAMEQWARDLGKKDVAALTAFLDKAQPIAALTATQTGGLPPAGTARGDAQLSRDELAICTAMGLTPEQYKAGAAAA